MTADQPTLPLRSTTAPRFQLRTQPTRPSYDRLAALAARAADASAAIIVLARDAGPVIAGCHAVPDTWLLADRQPLAPSIWRRVVLGAEVVSVADLRAAPEPADAPLDFAALLAVPLRLDDGRTIGALAIYECDPRWWSGDLVAALRDLATLIAAEIQRDEAARAQALLATAVDRLNEAFYALDRAWRFTCLNRTAEMLLGRSADELRGRSIWEAFPQMVGLPYFREFQRAATQQVPVAFELYEPLHEAWFEVRAHPSDDGLSVLLEDVTARRQTERALRQSERRYRGLVQGSPDIITVLAPDLTFSYLSPAIERVLGYHAAELLGRPLVDLVHPSDHDRLTDALDGVLHGRDGAASTEFRLRHHDGSWRDIEAIGGGASDLAGFDRIVLAARDVTERKRAEAFLTYQAFHDPLTRLPNRTVFTDRLTHALALAARRGEAVAVLFMDLDRFKTINDTLGHDAGDQLLIAVGQRIKACLRSGDTVARLGGDEFTVLLEGVTDAGMVREVARRITRAMEEPFLIDDHEVRTATSIGIAFSDPSYEQAEALLRDADIALYEAKARGRSRFEVFDPERHGAVLARRALEADLRRALDQGELRLDYQPAVELSTGAIVSVVALASWHHPDRGPIAPDALRLLALESGLSLSLLRWTLRRACGAAQSWRQRSLHRDDLTVSVGVPARLLQQPGLVDVVSSVLGETALPPDRLRLEIAGGARGDGRAPDVAALAALAELGVRLAIDDFGIGSSSLSALKHLPVDALIVDQSFVAGLEEAMEQVWVVRAVAMLARTLELQVTADGIETAESLAQARALGCDIGRGSFISPPLDRDALADLLRAGTIRLPG